MQIGPRIRVGGTLGKIGEAIKKPIGRTMQVAAPLVSLIPGVGTAAGIGLGALGGALGGKLAGDSDRDALLAGAATGAGAFGVDKLAGGASGMGGLRAVGSGLKGAVAGGGADGKGAFGALGDKLGSKGVRAVGSALLPGQQGGQQGGDGFGWDDLLRLGLGGVSAYEGIKSQQQSDALMKQAMQGATADYAAKAPLREAGLQQLLSAQAPDLSGLAVPGNPYARVRAVKKVA